MRLRAGDQAGQLRSAHKSQLYYSAAVPRWSDILILSQNLDFHTSPFRYIADMPPKSAIPDFYYFCFGAYEPFLTSVGFLGVFMYVCPFKL